MKEINLLSEFFTALQEVSQVYEINTLSLSPRYDSEEDMHYFSYLPQLDVHEDLSLIFIKLGLDVSLCESCAKIITLDVVFEKSDSFVEFLQKLPDNSFSSYLLAQKLDCCLAIKNKSPKKKI